MFACAHASGSCDVAFIVHRTHSPPVRRLPAVGLLPSSMVPTDLQCLSLVRCATNLVADVEVGSRCLLNFFRRSSKTKSYTSTPHCKPKVHKYWLQHLFLRRKVASRPPASPAKIIASSMINSFDPPTSFHVCVPAAICKKSVGPKGLEPELEKVPFHIQWV